MKKALKIALLLIVAVLFVGEAQAQNRQKVIYLQKYTNEPYHFGFLLGLNFMDYSLHLKENYQSVLHPQNQCPTIPGVSESLYNQYQILSVESAITPGFSVGVIGDKRLGEYFNLRFSPTLSLSSKFVNYEYQLYMDDEPYGEVRTLTSDDKLATFLEFPLHIKYRAKRYNNIDAYVLLGANPKLYLGSLKKTQTDASGRPALIQVNHTDLAFEFGGGFDIYNQWFKMGVEIKMSIGMINVLKTDALIENYFYHTAINDLRNKQLQVSFTFE